MKKAIWISFVLFIGNANLPAQEEQIKTANKKASPISHIQEPSLSESPNRFRDNLYFGGFINLSFGDYSVIGIEPMVGYYVTPKLSSGVKVRYDYIRDDRYGDSRTSSNYGGSLFGRYRINQIFYAQLEPAMYNYELFYRGGGSEREWIPYIFAGGGVRQPLYEKSWIYAEVMFDLLQDSKSPYDDWTPFFSIGAGTGF
ncbi:hypothetical protein [Pontiella agarivorans]|uniref:Outer membrane protein beta-barrel domain-containing protein n=1 Tax=Pontiella agarivorans TaxID=3038953 RepID=A0ABU5N014_9BACT|nr:hypothetical protein [Pontiella agarivorans]MDZ8119799.1 hypothetical protein [Pontiella agarivorans]